MTADINNNQIGGWRQYTHSATTAAWLAHHFYLHWLYSGDREFLEKRAYPYLAEASVFIEAITSKKGPDGLRTIRSALRRSITTTVPRRGSSYSPTRPRAHPWLLGPTAESRRNRENREAAMGRAGLANFPESTRRCGRILDAKDIRRLFAPPLLTLHAIHPWGYSDWSDGATRKRHIIASLNDHSTGSGPTHGAVTASHGSESRGRARDGAKAAERALEIFPPRSPSGTDSIARRQPARVFEYTSARHARSNFAAAAGVQEMLIQSSGEKSDIPAVPPNEGYPIHHDRLRCFLNRRRKKGGTYAGGDHRGKRGTVRSCFAVQREDITFP